jgi:Reverse transcriptase (RNA-dependent DNA polymerase)
MVRAKMASVYISTEMAIVSIYNDMIGILDMGHVRDLVHVDMLAAFDTVDHTILLDGLNRRFGIRSTALHWMSDFIGQRTQRIQVGNTTSIIGVISCGVPQGSVLAPKQFVMYSEDVPDVTKRYRINYRLYANDTQAVNHGIRSTTTELQGCITNVNAWCTCKRLQMNASKTEVLWFGTSANLRRTSRDGMQKIAQLARQLFGQQQLVRDLGVYFDTEFSMRRHIARIGQTCFDHLRRLHSVQQSLCQYITA